MTAIFLILIASIGLYGHEKGMEDCAMNKYELECTVIQGQEVCHKVLKDWCINYKDGDFNYRKEM